MTPKLLTDYLERFHAYGAKEIAYVQRRGYRTARWSYPQVAEAAWRFARELESRGIGANDRVMIWGEDCAEWVAAFFGCLLRGAVVVPMDQIATTDFARRVAQQVDAKLLVCSREHAGLDASLPEVELETLVETIAEHSAAPYPQVPVEPTHPVEIVFTSGTTAEPKGVVLSHRNILVNLVPIGTEIDNYRVYGRIFHPLRFLNLLPLSHVFGQFMGVFIPQLLPGVVIFQETLNPSETIRSIKRERVSVVVTVPRLLETLRAKIERDLEAAGEMDRFRRHFNVCAKERFWWRWWRFRKIHRQFGWKFWAFISGGAALDAETEEFWRRLGFVVIQGYGLTETTSLISVNHPFKLARGSIGTVLPGREIKLSETGEILVRGESVAAGYWVGKELQAVRGEEGWFRTGDLGEMDAAGNLFFKGRAKSVIVTPEGLNVYPEDLEAALRRQPEVRDCVVIGLAREKNAVPCAVLLLQGGADEAGAEAAVRRANESLAEFQHMRQWYVWPEEDFPRTSTQKPRAAVIQEFVTAKLSGEEKAPPAAGALGELIAKVTGRAPGALPADAGLATDLNLSSVERVELMSAIEDRYQIDLNEAEFTAATTLGKLEQMVRTGSGAVERVSFHYARWPHRAWMKPLRMVAYYTVLWPLTMILCRPRVAGREHLRDLRGPVIVISNHITYLDIGFVLAALPPRVRRNLAVAMEGERLEAMRRGAGGTWVERWKNKFWYFLTAGLLRAFPLPARAGFRESFAFMGELVDRKTNLLVFPEGMRTRNGKLNAFRAGIGMLVNNLSIPVVPLRIDGLFPLKVAHQAWAPAGMVSVTIGPPVRFAPGTEAEEIRRELERVVAGLRS